MPKNYTWEEYAARVKVLCSVNHSEGETDKGLLKPNSTVRMTTSGLRAEHDHAELETVVPVEFIRGGMNLLNGWGLYLVRNGKVFKDGEIIGGDVSPLHAIYHRVELQPSGLMRLVLEGTHLAVCQDCSDDHDHQHMH